MKKHSKIAISTLTSTILASALMTGCASTTSTDSTTSTAYSGVAQNVLLGAASGAVTQVNGNSEDVKDAATVGALLGLLGSIF